MILKIQIQGVERDVIPCGYADLADLTGDFA